MRILHTSDWHLGHKLLHRDREEEHQLVLDWLLELIQKEQVEILVVSGDVFDISNPPNVARKMYYEFLTKVVRTSCQHVIIIGGNHDSPAMLEAPKELLSNFNIHVCGSLPDQFEKQIVEIKDKMNQPLAVLAMVPFLRDRDLDRGYAGEGMLDRLQRIRNSILGHYEQLAVYIDNNYSSDIPKITTGHLYAFGAQASEQQNNIYIGDTENITASSYPDTFDYVALGHIHRAQAVGGLEHIRYSGSLIPLSFSETKDDKGVYLIDLEANQLANLTFHKAPIIRRLKTIQGSLEEVELKLRNFNTKDRELTPWLEVIVETDKIIPRLDLELRELVKGMNLEILKIKVIKEYKSLSEQNPTNDLDELDVIDVFKKRCTAFGTAPEDMESLEMTFRELMSWVEEQE